jgi:hypothetical protein
MQSTAEGQEHSKESQQQVEICMTTCFVIVPFLTSPDKQITGKFISRLIRAVRDNVQLS